MNGRRWDDETAQLVTAAIRVAIAPPVKPNSPTQIWSNVPRSSIEALREALEAIGIDWREVKKRAYAKEA